MIKLSDKETGAELGLITEKQFQVLIDELEEEYADDRDYYINRRTIELFESQGIDTELVGLLQRAIGDRDEMEIAWSRS